MSSKNFTVAVIGGGVCGLTCAIGLAKHGVSVQVYEAAEKFGEIGAGIGIGANAVHILRDLGILKDVLARSDEDEEQDFGWFQFRSGMGDHRLIYEYPVRPGEEPFGIHRAAFLDALVDHIDPNITHFNKRCVSVTVSESNPSEHIMKFTDGTTASANVVLGADGIKSAVRGAVTGEDPSKAITYSNTVCYRGLVKAEDLKAVGVKMNFTKRPIAFCGMDKHLIAFAIKAGKLINFVGFVTDRTVALGEGKLSDGQPTVVPVTNEELVAAFEGFGSDAQGLLRCVQRPDKWHINCVYPGLPSYVRGNVAILGDAAHGMLPHLGAGAGQGLEDAYLLCRLLSHPQTRLGNIQTVLQVYDEVRRPRAQRVWDDSWYAGGLYEGYGRVQPFPEGMREELPGMWDYVWGRGLEEDLRQAEKRLQELGVFNVLTNSQVTV